jgi:hypothetical protein
MARQDTPFRLLITKRCRELGLSRSDLVGRCDFKNITKGLRRLDAACDGDFDRAATLLEKLPAALAVSPEAVQRAATETVELMEREVESRTRASFKPTAFLVGTNDRPSQICIYGISGGAARWLKIPLDLRQPPLTYATQALSTAHGTRAVPFFGPTTGFIVNYTPDHAVRFDLEGIPIETFTHAYRPGEVTLHLSGRELPLSVLDER